MMHILKPAVSLFVVAAIAAVTLGVVNGLTLEPIENQRRRAQEKLLAEILREASEFRELRGGFSGSVVRVFEGIDGDGQKVGYVIELAPVGYGGAINMMVGISSTQNQIAGMRVMRHSETPGFGAAIKGERFFRRFDGLAISPLTVVRFGAGPGEFQAITSSTITSRAVVGAVNDAVEWYAANRGEE